MTSQFEEIAVALKDMDDWHAFVRENQEAIVEQYKSISAAYRHAIDGGLTLGGGASPIFRIYFED